MTNAALDRLLGVLLVSVGATGLLTLRAGTADLAGLFVVHELLSGSLLATIVLKLRRSVPRAIVAGHWARVAIGLLVAVLAIGSIAAGYAWVASGALPSVGVASFGTVTVLTLHVWLGLALLPVVIVHLVPRRWRLLRPGPTLLATAGRRLLTRRSLLTGLTLGGIALGTVGAAELTERLVGGTRRFTGSRLLARGGVPPPTTFFGEATPTIERATWRLKLDGRVARRGVLTIDELQALGERTVEATLDCTSGWALATTWRGIPLRAVLDASRPDDGAKTVEVRSMTGWGAVFPLDEAGGLLLATGVAGAQLLAGNGAPCRLVAPGRRGLDWVKWVTEINVS